MLLESNGVPKDVFLELQRRAVQEANAAMDSPADFIKVIETYSLGRSFALSSLIHQLASRGIIDFKGFKGQDEGVPGFFQRIAKLAISHALRDLKHHARIPVPESYTLVGVADEWNCLEDGQVYGESIMKFELSQVLP
jgi:RNA-dependent RNA polymerase